MNTENLAAVFAQIEQAAEAVESIAGGVLAAIQEAQADTLEKFNDMVADAYQRNGWSQKAGRPAEGSTERPAPQAVKVYVSIVRRAYRMELDVLSFEHMGALRSAIRQARTQDAHAGVRSPELRGVQVSSSDRLTGGLWHDAVVLYENLPDEQRTLFETQIRRLLKKYTKAAPEELLQAS